VSNIVGRAVGNLRQPNHLSSLLLWSAIAAVALLELRRVPRCRWAARRSWRMVFGVVLTASRTGLVSVLILALWGLLDRRLSRPVPALLLGTAPVVYAHRLVRHGTLGGDTATTCSAARRGWPRPMSRRRASASGATR
jgi:hypothetical protein